MGHKRTPAQVKGFKLTPMNWFVAVVNVAAVALVVRRLSLEFPKASELIHTLLGGAAATLFVWATVKKAETPIAERVLRLVCGGGRLSYLLSAAGILVIFMPLAHVRCQADGE